MTHVCWCLPHDLLSTSIEIMQPHGAVGNEGLALWLGTADSLTSVAVTHVVEARGSGFVTSPQYLALSYRALSALADIAEREGAYLVGQIHSHPGRYVDLSVLDVAKGVRVPDYLSLVCPHYAQRPRTSLDECGVHVFEHNTYRRMSHHEVARRIEITAESVTRILCEVDDD
jgi:proteasome lid subunit RPN8/RPN11